MLGAAEGGDAIHIEELELFLRIGVSAAERAEAQRLTVSITLWPAAGFQGLNDELAGTVDYATVCREVTALAAGRADKLIETLAAAIVDRLLAGFRIDRVRVELRKFILPDVKHVAVTLMRERGAGL